MTGKRPGMAGLVQRSLTFTKGMIATKRTEATSTEQVST